MTSVADKNARKRKCFGKVALDGKLPVQDHGHVVQAEVPNIDPGTVSFEKPCDITIQLALVALCTT